MEFTISKDVAKSYGDNGAVMVDFVNRYVSEADDVTVLIGGNPLELMYSNHRHHHLFMMQVMELNAWAMLERMIPWVYRTYKNHGFSYDYFLAEFNGWIAAANKFLPPEVAPAVVEVYKGFILEHEDNIKRSAAYSPQSVMPSAKFKEHFEPFLEMLTSGDAAGVIDFGETWVKSPEDLASFYLGILMPALVEVGKRWEDGTLSVAHEHLASGIANRLMAYWYYHAIKGEKKRGKAIVTSSAGEYHGIGGAMINDLLAIDGWQTIYLGADTPVDDLVVLVESFRPDIMVISVTMPFNINRASESIEAVKASKGGKGCHIYVGGQAFDFEPSLWKQTGADAYLQRADELVVDAREQMIN